MFGAYPTAPPPLASPVGVPHGCVAVRLQPMEVYVDDETKLTLHGLQQHYCKVKENEKNRKLFELLDVLEFNQVSCRGLGSRRDPRVGEFCGRLDGMFTEL